MKMTEGKNNKKRQKNKNK